MGATKLWVHFYAGFAIGIFWYYKGVSIILPFVMIEINFDRDIYRHGIRTCCGEDKRICQVTIHGRQK